MNKKEKNKLNLSTVDNKYKSYQILQNIVLKMLLTFHRETVKTSAAMGYEWLA